MDYSCFNCIFLLFYFFLLRSTSGRGSEAICGFPGTPAYGYVKEDKAIYQEGDVVFYSCRVGYILIGSPISRCTEDGTWTEDIPICDDSMTTLGVAFSTPTVPGHFAELAIDKDKETCSYLKPKKPRWWRIDLGQEHKVLSVAVTMISQDKFVKFTVFVIKTQGTSASYKRCASFSGKFGTQTIVLACAEGKGIEGQRVHIEDHNQTDGIFEICEVEVQVEKDTGYECGRPRREPYSITFEREDNKVEYGCLTGYELKGSAHRICHNSGQWAGEPPVCEPIICEKLDPLDNGITKLSVDSGRTPLEGSIAIYKCNEGYKLIGIKTRYCLKDGLWSGKSPQCKAIRCPIPDGKGLGGVYRLKNGTNSMGSIAVLKCKKGAKMEGDDPYILCTEDGEWTKPMSRCLLPNAAFYETAVAPRIAYHEAIIFGKVVAAIMIVIVLVLLYLHTQKRRNAAKPELPSRQCEPPMPPPRPPPRAKVGSIRTALMGLISRDCTDKDEFINKSTSEKTTSLPFGHNFSNDEETQGNNWALPQNSNTSQGNRPTVIEVEVVAQQYADGKDGNLESAEQSLEDSNSEEVPVNMEEIRGILPSTNPTKTDDYAEINYDQKRRSRLLKEQNSLESSPTIRASPVFSKEMDELKSSRSPTPPEHLNPNEIDGAKTKDSNLHSPTYESSVANEGNESQEQSRKEEAEVLKKKEKDIGTESAKNVESENALRPDVSRRRRVRTEDSPQVQEDKSVSRRFRRFQ